MNFALTLRIPGTPVAKGRPRFTRYGATFTPAKTAGYERTVAEFAQVAMLNARLKTTTEPVMVDIALVFPIPESWSKARKSAALIGHTAHTSKPDADNVAKALLDGIAGVVIDDDGQVTDLHVRKSYGLKPEAIVSVQSLTPHVAMEAV